MTTQSAAFNPPPNWPKPPKGWAPQPGWQPDPAWGPPPEGWDLWVRPTKEARVGDLNWGNLLSFRFWHMVLWAPVVIAIVPAMLFFPLFFVAYPVALAFVVWVGLAGGTLICPACRKRVKAGASRCRFCSTDLA